MQVYIKGQKPFTLKNQHFKAQGGEGMIYCMGDTAYKIYRDPLKVIPADKINELKLIHNPQVLAPIDVLFEYKTNQPIGFSMRYIDDTEYFCKLITRSFRLKNNISPAMIRDLVTRMQETLVDIHRCGILVVDFNEMNFLVDRLFKEVYFIDVDSYQTKTYRATAIMDSIRDRQAAPQVFNEGTDWFAFAVVVFQLYMGCHPYKGRHPHYSMKEIASLKMMDDNLSVFHNDVRLPVGSQDWSVIPAVHYEWFKRIFLFNERSAPPFANSVCSVSGSTPIVVMADERFTVHEIASYPDNVSAVRYYNGVRYAITDNGVYAGTKKIFDFTSVITVVELAVLNGDVIIAAYDAIEKMVVFSAADGTVIARMAAQGLMEANGLFYTVANDALLQHSFVKMNKLIHQTEIMCDIFAPAYQVYKGVIVQNILGTCWLALPYKPGACAQVHLTELDGYRIIDAACVSGNKSLIAVFIAELRGNYKRVIVCLASDCSSYTVRMEDSAIDMVNFTVLANGLCVATSGNHVLEAFYTNATVKVFDNPPLDSSMRLYTDGHKVLYADRTALFHISLGV